MVIQIKVITAWKKYSLPRQIWMS